MCARAAAAAITLVLLVLVTACSAAGGGNPPAAPNAAGTSAQPAGTPAPPPDPSARGPFGVGYTELSITDPTRNRTLPLSVWYPTARDATGTPAKYAIIAAFAVPTKDVLAGAPAAPGRFPVVIFSHGSNGTRFQSWFLTETLASHGFIVVAPDHPGNTFTDVGDTTSVVRAAHERPKDLRFLTDQLASFDADANSPLHDHLDTAHLGVSGHSYGGYTTLTGVAGSAYGDVPDPRIKAIAPLAPAASIIPEEQLRSVAVPMLIMGGTLDTTTPVASEVDRTYDIVRSTDKYEVVITGGNHDTYSVLCSADELLNDPSMPADLKTLAVNYLKENCTAAVIPFDVASAIVDRYVVSFFRVELAGDKRYRAYLSPTDRVTFRST